MVVGDDSTRGKMVSAKDVSEEMDNYFRRNPFREYSFDSYTSWRNTNDEYFADLVGSKQVDVLKKFLSLKLVFLAIIVVGLVLYFKPQRPRKILSKRDLAQQKSIHEGNLKDVQLFGEKNQFVLSKDLTLVDGKYLVGFDYVKTDDRIKWEYVRIPILRD